MKYLFYLVLGLTLVGCSKDNDDEPRPGNETTVKFINKLPRSFENVKIAYLSGSNAKLIKEVGTLAQGGDTGNILIRDQNVGKVFFYYDEGDKTYFTDHGFLIAQETFNNWEINTNTIFHQLQKTSALYPK